MSGEMMLAIAYGVVLTEASRGRAVDLAAGVERLRADGECRSNVSRAHCLANMLCAMKSLNSGEPIDAARVVAASERTHQGGQTHERYSEL